MEQRDNLRREIEDKLQRDERIVWYQRANPWRFFEVRDFILVPLSGAGFLMILWTILEYNGIQVFERVSFNTSNINTPFLIFLYVFFALITYIFIGRLIAKISRLKKTAYCITNKRIFIYTNAFIKPIRIYKATYGDDFRNTKSYPTVKLGSGGMMTYKSLLKSIERTSAHRNLYGGTDLYFSPNYRYNDANLTSIRFENVKDVSYVKAVFEEMRVRDGIMVYEGGVA